MPLVSCCGCAGGCQGPSPLSTRVRHLNDKTIRNHWRFAGCKLVFKDNRSQALPINIGVTVERLYSAPMVARKIKARYVEPMLLLRRQHLPEGADWTYEINLDGYRALAIKSAGKVQLRSYKKARDVTREKP
jgi:hypothetical protein